MRVRVYNVAYKYDLLLSGSPVGAVAELASLDFSPEYHI